MLKGTLTELKKDELTGRAAGLTHYSILALFPALPALVSRLGILGQSATQAVLDAGWSRRKSGPDPRETPVAQQRVESHEATS